MKKLFVFLVGLVAVFTLTSCVSTAYAQSDDVYTSENVNVKMVITYGTPFIVDDMIMYYVYNGCYYYPYWTNGMYCLHVYRYPITMDYYRRYYRPVPRDFYRHHRYNPTPRRHRLDGHYYQHNDRTHHSDRPHTIGRPNHNHNGNMNRPSTPHHNGGHMDRPHSPQRSSTRGGHFGGRR